MRRAGEIGLDCMFVNVLPCCRSVKPMGVLEAKDLIAISILRNVIPLWSTFHGTTNARSARRAQESRCVLYLSMRTRGS